VTAIDREQMRAVLQSAEAELNRRQQQAAELSRYIGALREAIAGLQGYLTTQQEMEG
jgi:hypothetical protein